MNERIFWVNPSSPLINNFNLGDFFEKGDRGNVTCIFITYICSTYAFIKCVILHIPINQLVTREAQIYSGNLITTYIAIRMLWSCFDGLMFEISSLIYNEQSSFFVFINSKICFPKRLHKPFGSFTQKKWDTVFCNLWKNVNLM